MLVVLQKKLAEYSMYSNTKLKVNSRASVIHEGINVKKVRRRIVLLEELFLFHRENGAREAFQLLKI